MAGDVGAYVGDSEQTTSCRRFVGRLAVVTGSARGIGAAIARRLADEGCDLVLLDRVEPPAILVETLQEAGSSVAVHCLDITNRDAVRGALADPRPIDLVVNNAGVAGVGLVGEISDDTWQRVIEVDAHAPLIVVQEALPRLRRGSAIVNVASLAAVLAFSSQAAYAVAKAGLVALGRNLAFELGPQGIRVNTVAPGPTETDLYAENNSEAATAARVARVPLGRLGQPHEVAAAVTFLGSSDASYINGAFLLVDGGFAGSGVR